MELNTQGINTKTVSMTDYQIVANNLAKVVVAHTGRQQLKDIFASLTEQMQYLAAPVEASFRQVKEGVMIGFVRANRAVRAIEDDKELRASYRVMGSNILMDNKDKTLWDLKEGAGGKYLARHGNEDLSELVSASINHRQDVPKLHQITMAKASRGEFVAFASASGDMDYGFCTRVGSDRIQVISTNKGQPVVIPHSVIAQIVQVKIPRSVHERLVKAGLSASDKAKEAEYYSRLYSYSPSYIADIKEQIEEGTGLV